MINVSRYKNNSIASKKKHIYSRLLDYFLVFIFTYFVFVISYMGASYLPVMEKLSSSLNDESIRAATYVDKTHLQRLSEDKTKLSDIDVDASNYVVNLVKTSAYYHELKYPYASGSAYEDKDIKIEETFFFDYKNYPLDNIAYYFRLFKINEPGLKYPEGININDNLYNTIMEFNSSYFIDELKDSFKQYEEYISPFVILKYDTTKLMLSRVGRGEKINELANSCYNNIYAGYSKAIQWGIKDVEDNSINYINIIKDFDSAYQKIVGSITLIYFLSYLLGYAIYVLISRLIAKEWITLGQKVMKLALNDKNEMELSFSRLFIYHLLNFILFSSSAFISFLLYGMLGITSFKLFGVIPLFAILLFILTTNIISLFMMFFNAKHHDVSTYLSGIYVKDINEFDAPIEEKENGK